MKRTRELFAVALLAALPSAGKADGVNRVYVDVAEKGKPVSANMYGLFFEEINHAGEGGLYGEMLQNRGFEEQTLPGGMTYRDGRAYAPHSLNYYGLDYVDSWVTWDIENRKYWGWQVNGIGCSLDKDVAAPDVPLHENTPNALRLRISDATEGSKVNVDNTGFYTGLSVKMASYAPLLVNVNQPNWSCNLIWFDSYRAMGRASYYLQRLMAENRPDYNVGVNMTQTQPDTTQTPYPLQFFVAGYDEARGEAVVKVVNADTKPYKTRLAVDGAERVAAKGRVITLKAARAEDENTLDEPQKIVPVEKAYGRFGRKFAYTFEPLSVTVLRIPATLKP